jgi:hypothetical protein
VPSKVIRHPLSRLDYLLEEDGAVRVVDGEQWGRFDGEGAWIEGPIKSCDPQLCRWMVSEVLLEQHARKRS